MPDHIPVLLQESLEYLIINPDGVYIDATFGRGGHSCAILDKLSDKGKLISIDKDLTAIDVAKKLKNDIKYKNKFEFFHGSFADLDICLESFGIKELDGILFDFGVSSPQLDNAERGFSFSKDGPLDMRMDTRVEVISASEWLKKVNHTDLSNVLYKYGDERYSRKIAKAIISYRDDGNEINSTKELAEIIKIAHPRWPKNIHPATKSFQAIRIFINNELDDIEAVLPKALEYLKPDGRLVCISFHSLEDRIVKKFVKDNLRPFHDVPKEIPILSKDMEPRIRVLTKGSSMKAQDNEISNNIRSRSAVMRVIAKI